MALGCGLGLVLGLVACTPTESGPPSLTEASEASTPEFSPGQSTQPTATASSGGTSPSAAPSSGASATPPPATGSPGVVAAGGTLQLTLQTTGVPTKALCKGFAQNTGQVVSGGGGLGGATVRLGTVLLSGQNEFILLPGEYSVHVSCTAEAAKWEGAASAVTVRKDERTQLGMELIPLP